jgi:hypothetical protein
MCTKLNVIGKLNLHSNRHHVRVKSSAKKKKTREFALPKPCKKTLVLQRHSLQRVSVGEFILKKKKKKKKNLLC